MRIFLALGLAALLCGCPNYGTVTVAEQPPDQAPVADAGVSDDQGSDAGSVVPSDDGGSGENKDAACDAAQPMCVPQCVGKTCGRDDGCGSECKRGSGCSSTCNDDDDNDDDDDLCTDVDPGKGQGRGHCKDRPHRHTRGLGHCKYDCE